MPTDAIDALIPPNPDAAPAAKKAPKKRSTTRSGRAAETAARRAASGDSKPKATTPAPRKASLETRLTDQLVMVGVTVAGVGSMVSPAVQGDGFIVVHHAPRVASALAQVADNDPKVKRALERMLTVGTYSALASALLPMTLAILTNHGVIAPELLDELAPDAMPDPTLMPQTAPPAPPPGSAALI